MTTKGANMDQATAYPLYAKVVAAFSRAELKGDSVPYTSLNGHMFSALHKDGTVALRLPAPDREAFLKKYKTSLAAHYGVVQPEYVVVPDKLLARTAELKPYFAKSLAYVSALKPKATTKKKATRKRPR
jgi:hypothetical protein